MSWETIENAITSRFKTQVADALSIDVHYDNQEFTEPYDTKWIRLLVRPGDTERMSYGGSTNRFRTHGVAIAQIMVPAGEGVEPAKEIADTIAAAFRSVTAGGVVYGVPYQQSVGRSGKQEWQLNVTCPWHADELL